MRLLVATVCAALLLGSVTAEPQVRRRRSHRRTSHSAHGKNPHELRSTLSNLQHRKAELRREYVKTRHQARVVVQDIHVVDARLERIEDELADTASNLRSGRAEQQELSKDLKFAIERVKIVRAQVARRLRYMYMHQGESVISAFAGVRSVEDLESTRVLLESVARKDHELFTEYRNLKSEIDTKKQREDALVIRIAELKRREQGQQNDLKYTRGVKANTLAQLRDRQEHIQQLIAQADADENEVAAEIRSYEAMARAHRGRGSRQPVVVFGGHFIHPARGPIVSGFGMRYHPILHRTRLHAGIDFGAPYGSPIVAAGAGVVIAARYSQSFGNMVVIDHGNGLSTLYAHASRLYVSAGQTVRQGQLIAAVGSTGLATGPHLHFEVRINGRPVNPMGHL